MLQEMMYILQHLTAGEVASEKLDDAGIAPISFNVRERAIIFYRVENLC
jgi:hypothetical protein